MKIMMNKLKNILNSRIVSAYNVTYAPEVSRNPELPIQVYRIAGNPEHLAWKSKAGNRLFTALLPDKNHFASFRADRTLSVNWSGWALLSPDQFECYCKTLKAHVVG